MTNSPERSVLVQVLAKQRAFLRQTVTGITDEQAAARTTEAIEAHAATFRMEPGDTVAGLLEDYERAAAETEKTIWSLESLDVEHPLPEAPWFPPNARWSVRQVFLHVLAETAQHCGHADIIREALDGSKTMG